MRFRFEISLVLLAIVFVAALTPMATATPGPRYPQCDCGDPNCSGNLLLCSTDDCECYNCVCGCGLLRTECPVDQCGDTPQRYCPNYPSVLVFVVTDEEYREEYSETYEQRVNDTIENAADEFVDKAGIDLVIKYLDHTFDSDVDGYMETVNATALLIEVQNETGWPQTDHDCDILLLYTCLNLTWDGVDIYGKAEMKYGNGTVWKNDDACVMESLPGWDLGDRGWLTQHETSHLFDCPDHFCDPVNHCVMNNYWGVGIYRQWCTAEGYECESCVNDNKDHVSSLDSSHDDIS